jgi:site-specific DNA-methyltransferase (adenine-specific)
VETGVTFRPIEQRPLNFHGVDIPEPGQWRVDRGDALAWLGGLPDESADLVVTDPAYESLEEHRARGTTTRLKKSKASSNEWFPIFPNARFPALFAELYRVLRRDRHCYMCSDQKTALVAIPIAQAAGFKWWKWLTWVKPTIGMGYHYRNRTELVLFFEKGKRKLADLGISDVLEFPAVRGGRPTEKPQGMFEVLVRQSALPGELVIDPFIGAGTAGAAALAHGCGFLGCDIVEKAVSHSRARLATAPNPQNARPWSNNGELDGPPVR